MLSRVSLLLLLSLLCNRIVEGRRGENSEDEKRPPGQEDTGSQTSETDNTVSGDVPPNPLDDKDLDHPLPVELFTLPREAQQQIKEKCRRNRGCKGQKEGHQNRRSEFKKLRSEALQKDRGRRRGKQKKDADNEVEVNFQTVFAVKKQLYDLLNVSDEAEPADDGMIGGDMILNKKQLDQLSTSLAEIQDTLNRRGKRPRGRRSALYFEDPKFEVEYWKNMPIPFWIDTSSGFNATQRNLIRQALADLTRMVGGRITFREIANPIDAPYIEYTSSNTPGVCGSSFVGQQLDNNNVFLNFACKGIYGSILHETMHSLGVAHHHTRLDRSNFVTINWNNVDPSCLDSFGLNDMNSFTTYGIPYSYGSVMHYSNMVCAVNTGVPTIIPKSALPSGVTMGQRTGLSQSDIDLLIRIYCCVGKTPAQCSCKDSSIYCGYDANIGYCQDTRYRAWMTKNCAKSCNLCKC